jgi:hypothetical protein
VRFIALLATVGAVLVLSGSASAALTVGVNDDVGKIETFAGWFFPTMQDEGLKVNTLTLPWDESDPTTIPAQDAITKAIANAEASGVSIEFDLYPLHSQAFTDSKKCAPSANPEACGNTSRIRQFASWAAQVAQAFPTVHQFIVMNECNQPLFVNPQWNSAGLNQSAAICGRALAASYDAIKSVNSSDFVWGVGLSPRGNDNPRAKTNSSTSPVKFIGYLGAWFKAFAAKTHRTVPLMDGFDFHPYPVPQSLPFDTGYPTKNNAAVTNLPRIYQAFYDAFSGSTQKTIGQQKGGGLPVSLNEVGIQTAAKGNLYVGDELSATAAGGVLGKWATESYQAQWYYQMLDYVACDPNVRVVNIFHLMDESILAGWQSGLFYSNRDPKQSAQAVQTWLSSTGGKCQDKVNRWKPAPVVVSKPAKPVKAAKVKPKAAKTKK